MKQLQQQYEKNKNRIENFLFPILLMFYPLIGVNRGLDVSDTIYSLANFQFFGEMNGTWMVATFLSNAIGNALMRLPFGNTLLGMYFYTKLIQSALAVIAYFCLRRRVGALATFLGECIALGLCWCPSVILYNYLSYFFMTVGAILLVTAVRERYFEKTESGRRATCLYLAAGLCLGLNIAVRMPNVVQAAFILVVWYGAFLSKQMKNRLAVAVKDTLLCLAGYVAGFGMPFIAICLKYGVQAYPDMITTMFAMTQKATDYKPAAMLTGMFGDYFVGGFWMLFALLCAGAFAFGLHFVQKWTKAWKKGHVMLLVAYGFVLLILLRFYWGRGMFSFRYFEYSSMYYPATLFLLLAIGMAIYSMVARKRGPEEKVFALLVLVQIFVTPLGSNNALYPIINAMFLVAPFVLGNLLHGNQLHENHLQSAFCPEGSAHDNSAYGKPMPEKAQSPAANADKRTDIKYAMWITSLFIAMFVCIQSVGFHICFTFQDGIYGEKRDTTIQTPGKVRGIYTGSDNGALLEELTVYAGSSGFAGRQLITYGEIPGMGYLLDMPSALSTFWPDLDSYRLVEFDRDMEIVESRMQGYSDADEKMVTGTANNVDADTKMEEPVIILTSPIAAYVGEDADGMNWFGTDREALDQDEKLQKIISFMKKYAYEETFCNGRYAVYEIMNEKKD